MKVDLPPETWRALHALVAEYVMPRYLALAQLEQAIQAAQQPAPSLSADKEPQP